MGKSARRNHREKCSALSEKSFLKDEEVDDADSKSSRFIYDEVDQFHAKRLGMKLSDTSDIDNETVDLDEDMDFIDDYDDKNAMNGIPSNKAWGKKKSSYYGGEDIKNVRGLEREELEDAEEEEALKIQQRLAEEIDEDQFELFQFPDASYGYDQGSQASEKVEMDVNSLSVKAQWKLLKQESPELKELLLDYKVKSTVLTEQITPLMELVKCGEISGNGAIYVQTKYNLYLSYLLNITFYLSQKLKRQSLVDHPVIKRLAQYRTLINKLSRLDEKLEGDVQSLLERKKYTFNKTSSKNKNMQLDIEYDGDVEDINDKPVLQENYLPQKPVTKKEVTEESTLTLSERLRLEEERKRELDKTKLNDNVKDEPDDNEERREIDKTIKKNKGIINKSKKRLGNPRIRHREKYRKAKIRRKGQVRQYRPEIEKYSGEMSGIKAGIIRSRTIG